MSKPKLSPDKYKIFTNAMQQMIANYGSQSLRQRMAMFSGGDPMADTKHTKAWSDYGWPVQITFDMHWNMWRRNGIASAVCSFPVDLTWITPPEIREKRKDDSEKINTKYDLAFADFAERIRLWEFMRDGDLCQRVGRYSGLLMYVADNKQLSESLEKVRAEQVLGIQPLYEGQLEPSEWEQNVTSHRYGLPTAYTVNESGVGNRNEYNVKSTGTVHHSRIIILAEGAIGNDIYGIPCLESIYNALLNWMKISGAGGEGFWRMAAQKFVMQAKDSEESPDLDSEEIKEITDMVSEMFQGLDKMPAIGGYEMKPLGGQLSSPEHFKNMIAEEIAAGSKIPWKIVAGTQSGVKAGDEDTAGFMRTAQSRRANPVTRYCKNAVDWCDEHVIELKKPAAGVCVEWDDLTASSMEKKAEIVDKITSAMQNTAASEEQFNVTNNELREMLGLEAQEEEAEEVERVDDDFEDELKND